MSYNAPAQVSNPPLRNDHDRLSRSEDVAPITTRHGQRLSAQPLVHAVSKSTMDRWVRNARRLKDRGQSLYLSLTPWQRVAFTIANVILVISLCLFIIFHQQIFAWMTPIAKSWRSTPGGWLILWFIVVVLSHPPLIGYSTCVTIAGFVWGMKGWFIVASASVVGSTIAFLVSRTILRSFVSRLTEKNKQFAALALVLKHDGLPLLIMIRLCPLPYSISNGAISTIQTVTWWNFMIATAAVSPKLLLHVFIGAELGNLAEHGGKMDLKTKLISYASILIGILLGVSVGYFIYTRTRARALQLEAEEVEAADIVEDGNLDNVGAWQYSDDPAERESINVLREDAEDVSLHTTAAKDEDSAERGLYRDDLADEDVFGVGDGDEDDDEVKGQQSKYVP